MGWFQTFSVSGLPGEGSIQVCVISSVRSHRVSDFPRTGSTAGNIPKTRATRPSCETVLKVSNPSPSRGPVLTIVDFVHHPITSRAHLLDFERYLTRHNLPATKHFESSPGIALKDLKACAEECNVTFEPGDILLVRIGFTEALLDLGKQGQADLMTREDKAWSGVEPTEEMMKWHWENGIAAVVTDGYARLVGLVRAC